MEERPKAVIIELVGDQQSDWLERVFEDQRLGHARPGYDYDLAIQIVIWTARAGLKIRLVTELLEWAEGKGSEIFNDTCKALQQVGSRGKSLMPLFLHELRNPAQSGQLEHYCKLIEDTLVVFRSEWDEGFGWLPPEFGKRYEAIKEKSRRFAHEKASRLQHDLNLEARSMPHETYADKQALAAWVNEHLHGIGLALKCPKTGRPALLVADVKDKKGDISRFRFEITDERGRKKRTYTSRTLPELELIEAEPRREPLRERAKKRRQA
jgi:hypothetical protein